MLFLLPYNCIHAKRGNNDTLKHAPDWNPPRIRKHTTLQYTPYIRIFDVRNYAIIFLMHIALYVAVNAKNKFRCHSRPKLAVIEPESYIPLLLSSYGFSWFSRFEKMSVDLRSSLVRYRGFFSLCLFC